MRSVRNIFKTGIGPSSSHTMGPAFAAQRFFGRYPDVDKVVVTLYGSLAKTGEGHGTDRAIREVFCGVDCEIVFNKDAVVLEHPNTMDICAELSSGETVTMRALSIGGGEILVDGEGRAAARDVYAEKSFTEIADRLGV